MFLAISLKRKIMFRVYAIWMLRQILSPFFLKTAFFLVVLAESLYYFSIPNIYQNFVLASANYSSFSGYMASVLQNTALMSKLLFAALAGLGIMFLIELSNILRRREVEIMVKI